MSDTPGSGRRPSGQARRRAIVEAYTDEERRLGRYVRTAYAINRSAYESACQGIEMRWAVPRKYDGVLKGSLDPQDANKKAVNVWFEMARWFLARKIDAQAFIQFVFSRLDVRSRIPEPAQVCNEGLIPAFTEFVTKGAAAVVAGDFETQTRTAQAAFLAYHNAFGAIDPARAEGKKWTITQNIILDRALPLSPLFRYLLARSSASDAEKEGDEELKYRFLALATGLFDRAVVQFWAHRDAYVEHWCRWLPKTFASDAERRFRKIAFNEAGEGDGDDVVA